MNREPFLTTLTRNTVAAAPLGAVLLIVLPRHAGLGWDFVDTFTLAFCFTFLGHYVEVVLLKIPGIETAVGRLVRVAGWFAGGLWCYVIARFLWLEYGRDLGELPALAYGGAFLVGLELALHGALNLLGRPNFYGPAAVSRTP